MGNAAVTTPNGSKREALLVIDGRALADWHGRHSNIEGHQLDRVGNTRNSTEACSVQSSRPQHMNGPIALDGQPNHWAHDGRHRDGPPASLAI